MKTLQEVFEGALQDEELAKALRGAEEKGTVVDFLKENGCEASAEAIAAFLKEMQGKLGELSDEELEDVAGGKFSFDRLLDVAKSSLKATLSDPLGVVNEIMDKAANPRYPGVYVQDILERRSKNL